MPPGVYQGYSRVPRTGREYTQFLDQYHSGWKDSVFGGGAYPVQPGQILNQGEPGFQGGGGQQSYAQMFRGADPRQITQGDPYKFLMNFANQGGNALSTAQGVTSPAQQFLSGALQTDDPMGTKGIGERFFQESAGNLREASRSAERQVRDRTSGAAATTRPGFEAFARRIGRGIEAGQLSEASGQATDIDRQERAATAAFQEGVSKTLSNLGLGLGGIALGEQGQQLGAAGQAGQLESFARNQWADILGSILRAEMGSRGGQQGPRLSLEDRYRMRPPSPRVGQNPYASDFYNVPTSQFGGYRQRDFR